MQSADLWRWISLTALGAALSGCASLGESFKGLKEAVSGASSTTSSPAAAPAPSEAAAATAAGRATPPAPRPRRLQ